MHQYLKGVIFIISYLGKKHKWITKAHQSLIPEVWWRPIIVNSSDNHVSVDLKFVLRERKQHILAAKPYI